MEKKRLTVLLPLLLLLAHVVVGLGVAPNTMVLETSASPAMAACGCCEAEAVVADRGEGEEEGNGITTVTLLLLPSAVGVVGNIVGVVASIALELCGVSPPAGPTTALLCAAPTVAAVVGNDGNVVPELERAVSVSAPVLVIAAVPVFVPPSCPDTAALDPCPVGSAAELRAPAAVAVVMLPLVMSVPFATVVVPATNCMGPLNKLKTTSI